MQNEFFSEEHTMQTVHSLIQRPWLAASLLAAMTTLSLPAMAGKTLDTIKTRGSLNCGVNTSLPGFSAADSQGNWSGLDVDVCKAVAATVLNDASKVKWTPLNASQRFAVLQAGEIDILSRNTTWTLNRDASLGLHFTGTTYYDGQEPQRRHGLRAIGHHHRKEPERLFQNEQLEHQTRGV